MFAILIILLSILRFRLKVVFTISDLMDPFLWIILLETFVLD